MHRRISNSQPVLLKLEAAVLTPSVVAGDGCRTRQTHTEVPFGAASLHGLHVLRSIVFVRVAAPRALWPQTGPDGLVCRAIRQTSQADTTSWLCRGPELATRRPRRNTIEHCLGCCFVKVEKIGEKCSSCCDRWAKLQPDLELKTCTQCGKMCWRPNMYDLCISCFCEHVLSQ